MAENNINSALGQEDKVLWDTKLTVRDAALKSWAINLLEDQHKEWRGLFDKKFEEQESKLLESSKGSSLKKPVSDFEADKDGGVGISKSAINNSIKALKEEVLQLFEDDRRLRNIRF